MPGVAGSHSRPIHHPYNTILTSRLLQRNTFLYHFATIYVNKNYDAFKWLIIAHSAHLADLSKQRKRECVTRFSTSIFFHDSNPSRLLMNRLKYFRIQFRFAKIFDHKVRKIRLRGVQHIAESDSAV